MVVDLVLILVVSEMFCFLRVVHPFQAVRTTECVFVPDVARWVEYLSRPPLSLRKTTQGLPYDGIGEHVRAEGTNEVVLGAGAVCLLSAQVSVVAAVCYDHDYYLIK